MRDARTIASCHINTCREREIFVHRRPDDCVLSKMDDGRVEKSINGRPRAVFMLIRTLLIIANACSAFGNEKHRGGATAAAATERRKKMSSEVLTRGQSNQYSETGLEHR